ncbi:MAG: FG-GAP-like repeat-containing protein [Halothiobacillus sp.]|nr:FG-GAP-like repeat-containing protein [Halothiobacillus sp.]
MPYIATKPATALLIVLWLLSPATAQQHDQARPAPVAPDSAQLSSSDWYTDVTTTHLPVGVTDALSMDAGVVDVDGDGDQDIIVVSEDDQTNELYLNDGNGFFMDASDRLPVTGTPNAVVVADLVGDELPDILIGNNGQNVLLLNTGDATFKDVTAGHLPQQDDVTQDLALAAADAEAFAEAPGRYYDSNLASRLVNTLYAPRNSVDPAYAYRAFRGRDADVDALLRTRGFPVPDTAE